MTPAITPAPPGTRHHFTEVHGRRVFYREAGDPAAPAIVLLHGAPASSFMFRDLIPLLASTYHVIAPDYVGFGLSEAPTTDEFSYTFDSLTDIAGALLGQLGVTRYAVYVQDYGAPVGWRLILRDPGAVTAVITQNGNAYTEGFVPSFWDPVWAYAADRTRIPNSPCAPGSAWMRSGGSTPTVNLNGISSARTPGTTTSTPCSGPATSRCS